jgi:hypothetical protein
MTHRRNQLGRQVICGVDLMIDFATLGEYGLEPSADGSCRERAERRPRPSRRPGWEASATTRRGACAPAPAQAAPALRKASRGRENWTFPRPASPQVDFRGAIQRYAA